MRNTKGRKGVEKSLYGTQKRSNINDLRTLLSRLCQKEDDRGGLGRHRRSYVCIPWCAFRIFAPKCENMLQI